MKRNAIARIIIHSIIALVLTGILVGAIALNELSFIFGDSGGTVVEQEGYVPAADIQKLEIDWASGTVSIYVADTDQITFSETAPENCKYQMTYDVSGNTLSIDYAKSTMLVGFGSKPEKDLIVTVPRDWSCIELEIDAAAVKVTVTGIEVKHIDLDGAAMAFDFDGAFQTLSCDGAGCELKLTTAYGSAQIELDGAGCDLQLILPQDCGFQVQMDGLGCSYSSDIASYQEDGCIVYGDRSCHVNVDGIGCHVAIHYREPIPTIAVTE